MKNRYVDLKEVCEKYLEKKCGLDELSEVLSWAAFPKEMEKTMDGIDYKLEKIKFCVSQPDRYNEAAAIVKKILYELKRG